MYNSAIALKKGIVTKFSMFLGEFPTGTFNAIIQDIKTNSDSEDIRYLDALPRFKEWTDKRQEAFYKEYLQTIRVKDWQNTIPVKRTTLEDSKSTLGANLEKEIRTMAKDYISFKDDKVYDLLVDNGTAYDGSAFFATSHNIDGTDAIDNLKTGTAVTLAGLETDFQTATTALWGYKDAADRPINSGATFTVYIPPHLNWKFKALQGSLEVDNAAATGTKTNVLKNSFDIVVNSWQSSSDDDWYVAVNNAAVKPFINLDRQGLKWSIKNDPEDIYIKYLADFRLMPGYGAFTSMLKVDN